MACQVVARSKVAVGGPELLPGDKVNVPDLVSDAKLLIKEATA
jgi:hypothetical protein